MNNTLISKNTYARIIVDIDKEYKVKNINDGFTELTGYNEQDINDGLFINRNKKLHYPITVISVNIRNTKTSNSYFVIIFADNFMLHTTLAIV